MSERAPLPTLVEPDAPAARRPTRRGGARSLDDPTVGDPGAERIVLLEFRWIGPNGTQPVLYLDRRLLH